MKFFSILVLAIGLITFASCTKDVGPNPDLIVVEEVGPNPCDTMIVSYNTHIKPIMTNKCVSCHVTGTGSGAPGDFNVYNDIKSREVAVKNRVLVIHDMPQLPSSPPLPQSELDLIKCWLEAGAPNN